MNQYTDQQIAEMETKAKYYDEMRRPHPAWTRRQIIYNWGVGIGIGMTIWLVGLVLFVISFKMVKLFLAS